MRQFTFTSATAPLAYHHGDPTVFTLDVQVRQGDSDNHPPVPEGTVAITRTPVALVGGDGSPVGPPEQVATLQLDQDGRASMPLGTLEVGDYRFDVAYLGDATYEPSSSWRYVSVSAPVVVDPGPPNPETDPRLVPTLSWSIAPDNPVDDGPISMTVTVSGAAGTPQGEIEIGTVDTNDHYSRHTLSAGRASTVFGLPAGTQRLYVGYLGDATYRPASNAPGYASVTVLPRGGEVELGVPSALTGAVGSPTTFTVRVTSPWHLPAELLVEVDGVRVSTPAVPSSGVVPVTVPGQAPGVHAITLRTAATDDYPAASATVSLTVAASTPPARATEQPTGDVRASAARTAPGAAITVSASGYLAGEVVAFYLHSDPVFLGTAVADAAGVATLTVTVPADAPVGAHHIRGIGGTSGVWAEVPVTLAAGTGTAGGTAAAGTAGTTGDPSTRALAATGTGVITGLAAAAGLLLLGTGALALRRRLEAGRAG
ncbi:Ig-like domain repeat protein [Cellulomonas sp. Y8]|uniref:Ig-like domain repeat protein n=1 Tax=Cellulomonas sp. Y8 TaxID=2591145 RepID=UPI00143CE60B|nr:Ig-like domain repeat protein [Cellulomonas sp. Y8]